MASAVIFDVNETLLDLNALDPLFAEWFGDESTRRAWFAQTLHYALTLAATRAFRGFGDIGIAALISIAESRGVPLPDDAVPRLRQAILRLPPHADVEPALRLMRAAGFRIGALSNNALPALREQLRHAGLSPLFDEIMSIDEAGALKPAPEVYRFAAERFHLPPGAIWMVAAHGWDIAGAMRVGMRGAFVARPGQRPNPFSLPEIAADSLVEVARAIIDTAHGNQTNENGGGFRRPRRID